MRKKIILITMSILMNLLILGYMQVYKISYNTMNSEHIAMADISMNNKTGMTELKILDKTINLDISPNDIKTDDNIIYMLYTLSNNKLKNAVEIIYYIEEIIY